MRVCSVARGRGAHPKALVVLVPAVAPATRARVAAVRRWPPAVAVGERRPLRHLLSRVVGVEGQLARTRRLADGTKMRPSGKNRRVAAGLRRPSRRWRGSGWRRRRRRLLRLGWFGRWPQQTKFGRSLPRALLGQLVEVKLFALGRGALRPTARPGRRLHHGRRRPLPAGRRHNHLLGKRPKLSVLML